MKHTLLRRLFPFCVLITVLFVAGCKNDQWDEHYDEASFNLPDKTLKAYIQDDADLSIFSEMLEISGLGSVINASQAFTIWAPTDEALAGIDLSDTVLVRNTVTNHISRSRITTSGLISRHVRTIGGKYIFFSRQGTEFTFGDNSLIASNISTSNGLVHKINGYAPYLANIWEFIGLSQNLDSLRSYLYGKDQKVFDEANSIDIGENEAGQVIYDSVFVESNPILDKIGNLKGEENIFTTIIPDNTAWSEAYARITKFFNFPTIDGGAARQREYTQWNLVRDMVFRGSVDQPDELDSLVSSTGNVFYSPEFIFSNAQKEELSNGLAYVTNLMPYTATSSWFKPISVEAEESDSRLQVKNGKVFERTSYGSDLSVSENGYILVEPTAAGPLVEFSIPNVLSGKYNIYCVFVPASIVNPTNMTPTKVKFRLTYIRSASGGTFGTNITPDNNVTDPDGVTKMLVTQFEFPYANVVDEEFDRAAISLQVINAVSLTEEQSGEFSRSMRIDRIILEPVSE